MAPSGRPAPVHSLIWRAKVFVPMLAAVAPLLAKSCTAPTAPWARSWVGQSRLPSWTGIE